MKYIDAEEILLIHHQLIERYGGSHGVRDLERIKSSAQAPAQHVFGKEQYKDVYEKAAVYACNLITDHPFHDGNKRTGIVTAIMFLNKNSYILTAKQGEVENIAVKIAVDKLGINDIATWFRQHVSK